MDKQKPLNKKNFEIRFKTTGETFNLVKELWELGFFDLKKSAFFEKVFLLGLSQLKTQLQKQ